MRVLLTGGTGFVGRVVVRHLIRNEAALGLMMRQEDSEPPGYPAARFILGASAWREEALSDVLRVFAPDAILHLAGKARAASTEDLYEANTFLGERLMAAAGSAAPNARILVAGSAAEYGPPASGNGTSREDDGCRPVTAYGIAKLAQTMHALIRSARGQPISIARIFNPVGPGMPHGLAFQDFAQRLAARPDQLAIGDVDTARDFMDVEEAARILVELLTCSTAVGQVINVCSGIAQPLRGGVERMIARVGRALHLVSDPALARSADVRLIRGDTSRLEALGIRPASADIDQALDRLVDAALAVRAPRDECPGVSEAHS